MSEMTFDRYVATEFDRNAGIFSRAMRFTCEELSASGEHVEYVCHKDIEAYVLTTNHARFQERLDAHCFGLRFLPEFVQR